MGIRQREQVVGKTSPGVRLADVGARALGDGKRGAQHIDQPVPALLRVEELRVVHVRLAQVWSLRDGAVQPALRRIVLFKRAQAAGDVAHRRAAFVRPDGGGQRQVPRERFNGLLPLAAEHILPPEVVAVSVVLRVLPNGQLQQRQVLPAGLRLVWVMVELHAGRVHEALRTLAGVGKRLMHRTCPAVAAVFVNFIRPEHHALAAVGAEAPGVTVAGAGGVRLPCTLQRGAPARVELLVEIDGAADVRVGGNEPQRLVPRRVEAPRRDDRLAHDGSACAELFYGVVA